MEDGPPFFPPDSSCPAVLWIQLALSTFRVRDFHTILLAFPYHSTNLFARCAGPQPQRINPLVWPLPRSLATTSGISVDFSSSPYLDVSVQAVPHLRLFDSTQVDRVLLCRVSPFGNLRINGHLHLPAAYRSLSRPSSAPDAKAFPLCSYQLDLLSFEKESRQRKLCARRMVTSVRTVCLSLPLSVEERGKLWFSLSLNYAGFRVFTKLFVLPFAKKFHK